VCPLECLSGGVWISRLKAGIPKVEQMRRLVCLQPGKSSEYLPRLLWACLCRKAEGKQIQPACFDPLIPYVR
jgi:hypothetical protein